MNTTVDEIHNAGFNETVIHDFEDFDNMDLVNVLTYLVISISKYLHHSFDLERQLRHYLADQFRNQA